MAREILLPISYANIFSTNEAQSEGNSFQVFFPKVNLFCFCLKTEILFQTICMSSFQIRNQILAQEVLFLTFQAPQKPQAYIKCIYTHIYTYTNMCIYIYKTYITQTESATRIYRFCYWGVLEIPSVP